MLNSKYAPVVALTVVGIIIVAVLGWFLAINPQLSQASSIRAQAGEVSQNVQLIEEASASLDQAQVDLEAAPDFSEAIVSNAPSVYDVESVRNRLSAAIEESGVELVSIESSDSSSVEGIEADGASLPSNRIAQLFQQGPVQPVDGAEAFAPVVVPTTETGPVVETLFGIPLDIVVSGTPQQSLDFFEQLADPEDQIFQMESYTLEGREEGDTAVGGSPASAGDVLLTLRGYLYFLDPEATIMDEESLVPAELSGDSPFRGAGEASPQGGEG